MVAEEVRDVKMDPAVHEAEVVLRELRELRAACSFFGVGQSGSRHQRYQGIVSKLKEIE